MKSTGAGARGGLRSGISISCGRRLPLRMLQGAHEVTTFSQTESPPRERGTTWSSVSRPLAVPQYMQRQPSRANKARRGIFRFSVRRPRTERASRITYGQGQAPVAQGDGLFVPPVHLA